MLFGLCRVMLCYAMVCYVVVFASQLQSVFNTSSSNMFVIFGCGVPLYFLMSVNRGTYQGKKSYKDLSITYQGEMLSRLVITLAIILLLGIKASWVIALGILLSFVFGLYPFKTSQISFNKTLNLELYFVYVYFLQEF